MNNQKQRSYQEEAVRQRNCAYVEGAKESLKRWGVEMRVEPMGRELFTANPREGTRAKYLITLSKGEVSRAFEFTQSFMMSNLESVPSGRMWALPPSAYDLLACVQKYEVGTFADFCGEFGYDSDSRKALETYLAVQEEYEKVRALFKGKELEELREIQ